MQDLFFRNHETSASRGANQLPFVLHLKFYAASMRMNFRNMPFSKIIHASVYRKSIMLLKCAVEPIKPILKRSSVFVI